jgi:glycogen phosphorylase
MSTKPVARPDSAKVVPMAPKTADISELLQPHGSGAIQFAGTDDALYKRHLVFDRAIDPKAASARERFEAFSHSLRDILAQRWVWHYDHEPETRAALDLIFSDYFSRNDPAVFAPLRDTLLTHGDHYMHLGDLTSYAQAQDLLGELSTNPGEWARKAILNVASSGKFSSNRTIHQYATEIWKAESCPIP